MIDKLPKPAPRGMCTSFIQFDELMYPPEKVIFEVENVKFSRVDFVKDEHGFYHGKLDEGDLFAVDVDCGGRNARFSIGFEREAVAAKRPDLDKHVKHALQTWCIDDEDSKRYLSDAVRVKILDHLHEVAARICTRRLDEASGIKLN